MNELTPISFYQGLIFIMSTPTFGSDRFLYYCPQKLAQTLHHEASKYQSKTQYVIENRGIFFDTSQTIAMGAMGLPAVGFVVLSAWQDLLLGALVTSWSPDWGLQGTRLLTRPGASCSGQKKKDPSQSFIWPFCPFHSLSHCCEYSVLIILSIFMCYNRVLHLDH